MNIIKTKPAFVIAGTLIIGMILGALSLSAFMRYRMQHLHKMMGRAGFQKEFLETIQPVDEKQRKEIEQIISQSSVRLDSTINQSRIRLDAMMDSMKVELNAHLTAEQKARLERLMGERFRGHGNPPFARPPFGGKPPRPPFDGNRPDGPPPGGNPPPEPPHDGHHPEPPPPDRPAN